MSFGPPKAPKKNFFFESEFASIPKNSGLNPWSFQFWGHPRLGPRAKLPPPLKPAAGSASVRACVVARAVCRDFLLLFYLYLYFLQIINE